MATTIQRGKIGSRSLKKALGGAASAAAPANGASLNGGVIGYRKDVIKLDAVAFALTDVAATVAYVGKKLLDFPEGLIHIAGASANLTVTKSSAGVNNDFDGDFSVGSATASNNATLTSTEQDIIPSTPTPQAVAGATTAKGKSTAGVLLDGTTTPVDLYLNFLVDDADQDVTTTPANLVVSGTITVVWANLGDV